MKTNKIPTDAHGRKFLFYYLSKPVFEGDETHKRLKECKEKFDGDITKMTKDSIRSIQKFLKK